MNTFQIDEQDMAEVNAQIPRQLYKSKGEADSIYTKIALEGNAKSVHFELTY